MLISKFYWKFLLTLVGKNLNTFSVFGGVTGKNNEIDGNPLMLFGLLCLPDGVQFGTSIGVELCTPVTMTHNEATTTKKCISSKNLCGDGYKATRVRKCCEESKAASYWLKFY